MFVGRLSKEKGVELLAKSAELLPEYKFVVAGSGPDEDILKNKKNICRTGFLSGEELTDIISGAKALIAPSICFENCPLSILEAHSMGVPVITMNSGGMAELAEDGVTGALAQKPEPEYVAKAVRKILCNEEKYRQIKENCVKHSAEILDAEDYCKILVDKYIELIR